MDITSILISLGPLALVAVALIVFVENGLLFPFLPGDSLVFAAAIVAGGDPHQLDAHRGHRRGGRVGRR